MSRDIFGFKDEPFSAYPDNKYFFSSILHDKAITLLEYGLNSRKGFMLLTGLKGTGKTMTCNILKDSVKECNVSVLNYESTSPDKLMKSICEGFGLDFKETDRKELFGLIMEYFVEQYKEGRNNLIVVDNAESISDENLEMLSEFMEIEIEKCKLVQVILSGCPELHDRLRNVGNDLGPKFTFTVELAPLNLQDTIDYVEHRIKTAIGDDEHFLFKKNSCIEIYNYSKGVPSEINRIAHKALAIAKEKKKAKVTPRHIKMSAARLYGVKSTRKGLNKPVAVLVLFGLLAGGIYQYKDKLLSVATDINIKGMVVQNAEPETKTEPVVVPEPIVENTPEPVSEPETTVEAPIEEPRITEETVEVKPETITEEKPEPDLTTKPVEVVAPEPEPEPVVEEVVPEPVVVIYHGCTVAQSGLKVRLGPSVESELIGTVPYMAYIELLEKTNDGLWWKTRFEGKIGYMYAKYIRVVDSPDACKQ